MIFYTHFCLSNGFVCSICILFRVYFFILVIWITSWRGDFLVTIPQLHRPKCHTVADISIHSIDLSVFPSNSHAIKFDIGGYLQATSARLLPPKEHRHNINGSFSWNYIQQIVIILFARIFHLSESIHLYLFIPSSFYIFIDGQRRQWKNKQLSNRYSNVFFLSSDIYHCARKTITSNVDTHIFFVFFSFYFVVVEVVAVAPVYLESLMGYYTFWSECNELGCVFVCAPPQIYTEPLTREQIV